MLEMNLKSFKLVITFASFLTLCLVAEGQVPFSEIPEDLRKYALNESILEWEAPDIVQRTCPYYLSGFDEENRPIWIIELGKWPTAELLANGPEWVDINNTYVHQLIYRAYKSLEIHATPTQPVKEANVIIDMDKYLLRNSIGSITAITVITDQFRLIAQLAKFGNSIVVVNTNFFAQTMVNILRPVLGSALERVEIYGTNSKAWIPKLLKILPGDQLPQKYGGVKEFKPLKAYG